MDYQISQDAIFFLVEKELERARDLHPGNKMRLLALNEEVGEVTKAFLDMHEGKETPDAIFEELIQVIAVCVRLIQEGDHQFPGFKADLSSYRPMWLKK